MKTLGLLGFTITVLIGFSQPVQAGSRDRNDGYYYPSDYPLDSSGRVPLVRLVQRALQEEGYYVGDSYGNYCWETRVAVRRYQRDKGLRMSGKIDSAVLDSLGLRQPSS